MTKAEIRACPIWRVVVGGLIVVGFCSFLCWYFGWCWWCPDCPDVDCCDEPDYAAEIILEDMHAGVWMAIDNSEFHFKDPNADASETVETDETDETDEDHPDPTPVCEEENKSAWGECEDNYEVGVTYRHGILLQTGPVFEFEDSSVKSDTRYGGVYIEHDAGEVWLLPTEPGETGTDFDWLDVMDTGTKCVIDPSHAYEMVHILGDDDKAVEHVEAHSISTSNEDLVPNKCDATSVATKYDVGCMRNRSIHASVLPSRIITYWVTKEMDYGLTSGPTTEIPIERDGGSSIPTHENVNHVSYTFQLPNPVVVDRWNDGCHEERYTGVTLIRILHHNSSVFHLGYPHKPMDGG